MASTPVFLRNGEAAFVTGRLRDPESAFTMIGHRASAPAVVELWTEEGHWREDRDPHHFDIVTLVAANGEKIDAKEFQK